MSLTEYLCGELTVLQPVASARHQNSFVDADDVGLSAGKEGGGTRQTSTHEMPLLGCFEKQHSEEIARKLRLDFFSGYLGSTGRGEGGGGCLRNTRE